MSSCPRHFKTLKYFLFGGDGYFSLCNHLLMNLFLTQYRPAIPFGDGINYFKEYCQFSIVKILKISPPRNLKLNNIGIFQSLKLRN